jgi:hypothetical protein
MRDRSVELALVPIQTAVYKLAKVGQALEKGDASGAAATLADSWVTDFAAAGDGLAKTPDNKAKLQQISGAIQGTSDAVGVGNVAAAKVAFVGAAKAIEEWVQAEGIAGQLKGL